MPVWGGSDKGDPNETGCHHQRKQASLGVGIQLSKAQGMNSTVEQRFLAESLKQSVRQTMKSLSAERGLRDAIVFAAPYLLPSRWHIFPNSGSIAAENWRFQG
jgi:hypothetical protein